MSANPCDLVRPVLPRIAEGEASPADAIRVARHLPDCTACRILLARERRLGSILEEELEDALPVGEDFLRSVMDNLPLEPPPPPRKRKTRRSLKLACFVGLLAGMPALAMRLADAGASRLPTLSLPQIEAGGLDGGLAVILGWGRVLLSAADTLGRHVPAIQAPSGALGILAALGLVAAAVGGIGATTVLAMASHRISKLI